MKDVTLNIGAHVIELCAPSESNTCYSITTNLHVPESEKKDLGYHSEEWHEIEAHDNQVDGIESMILALYVEGYDVEEPKFIEAITTVIDALDNN